MDFSKLGGLGDIIGKAMGNNVAKSLPLEKIFQGVLDKLGIKMDPAKVKELVDNPAVQQLVNKAISAITGAKNADTANTLLEKLADKILAQAPNTNVSKSDLAGTLKDELLKKLG